MGKFKITFNKTFLYLFIIAILTCIILYQQYHMPSYYSFRGSFKVENSDKYLLINDGNLFCIYSQSHGILHNGTYKMIDSHYFYLEDQEQNSHYAILTNMGLDLLDVRDNSIQSYKKLANHFILYDIEDEYPSWCINP